MAKDKGEQGTTEQTQPRTRGIDDSFTCRAAQRVVVAELLRYRCNAAIPEVDLGVDVLAFREEKVDIARLPVKACTAPHPYADGSGYSAKFALPMNQLSLPERTPLYYVLAVLREGKWVDFLIVRRDRLRAYYRGSEKFGSFNKRNDELEITVEFREQVKCSGQDLTDCRNAWTSLPPLQPDDPEQATQNEEAFGPD